MTVLIVFHGLLMVTKILFLGFLSAFTDIAAFIVLWLAIARADYCLAITYSILNLFECFALVVVLGYYLQTDMGKNVPNKQKGEDDTPNT